MDIVIFSSLQETCGSTCTTTWTEMVRLIKVTICIKILLFLYRKMTISCLSIHLIRHAQLWLSLAQVCYECGSLHNTIVSVRLLSKYWKINHSARFSRLHTPQVPQAFLTLIDIQGKFTRPGSSIRLVQPGLTTSHLLKSAELQHSWVVSQRMSSGDTIHTHL